ncbi:J domain-containing protein [Rhodopila sp.]|uniref:J domain-containing protein n=1 Tax=Rhodopila sp. TaxID=2480087 RepID=UPI003D1200EB
MAPPRTHLDPEGYYACLGLEPAASRNAIITAFRRKARVLHPDVPRTGDTSAFVALRRAYDVLSNRERRETYDRTAREAEAKASALHSAKAPGMGTAEREWSDIEPKVQRSSYETTTKLVRRPRLSDLPMPVWLGLGAFLCLCLLEAVLHLRSPPPVANDGIRPNAAPVAPLSPSAQRAVLYGPAPVRLAGVPNFYVVPAAGATVLWRQETERSGLIPVGQLPPFSSVQALRLFRQNGLVEVRLNETTNGFIEAKHLMPGDAATARRAYCGYNAGPAPSDGELLERRDSGTGTIQLENRAIEPAVVKLRDTSGAVALSVFLAPGGHVVLAGVPNGTFRPDFAVGELWSRACNSFAAGMRARRMADSLIITPQSRLVVPPDDELAAVDIPDQAFERN